MWDRADWLRAKLVKNRNGMVQSAEACTNWAQGGGRKQKAGRGQHQLQGGLEEVAPDGCCIHAVQCTIWHARLHQVAGRQGSERLDQQSASSQRRADTDGQAAQAADHTPAAERPRPAPHRRRLTAAGPQPSNGAAPSTLLVDIRRHWPALPHRPHWCCCWCSS